MSAGTKIHYSEACEVAEAVAERLRPTVQRLEVVGSLRRKVMRVGDIEFLAEPFFDEDLLGGRTAITDPVKKVLRELGTWVKGGDRMMQVTDVLGREGLKLEIYLVAPPAQWGSLLAIRTGPRDLGRHCVTAMRAKGYRHTGGHVETLYDGELVPTPTEKDFFELAGVPCLPPGRRDEQAIQLEQRNGFR